MEKRVLSCESHDYLEIACLFGYKLRLTTKNHQILKGKAVDTLTDRDKREYLIISDGHKQRIELSDLKKLQVLTPNARFNEIDF